MVVLTCLVTIHGWHGSLVALELLAACAGMDVVQDCFPPKYVTLTCLHSFADNSTAHNTNSTRTCRAV